MAGTLTHLEYIVVHFSKQFLIVQTLEHPEIIKHSVKNK
jgi:hypothetical protein